MVTSRPDKDDGSVAGQVGALPPAQPIPPASSLPPSQQYNQWVPQPHMDFSIPELNCNRALDASLFDMIRYKSFQPIEAAPEAPFAQPAIPPPPEMQPLMQTQHFNQQLPAMATMQESQYHVYLEADPVDAAAHYPVLSDLLPPPDAAAKSASGRRRARPPGSAIKSKPKPNKLAKTAAAAGTLDQERSTQQPPVATAADPTAWAWLAAGLEEEEEVMEYADTSPPGVRFTPSDAEIIGYLRRKYLGRRMPVDFIKEFDVFKDHPSTIQEECGDSINGSWYVFSRRHRKYKNGFRPTRSVGEVGYWKSNTVEAAIIVNGVEIGRVNSLTFTLGCQPKGTPTLWKMKEYRIKECQLKPNPLSMLLDPWVICKLFRADAEDQHGVPVQVGEQTDEVDEHVDAANGGGEDNINRNQQPWNDPEQELSIEDYLALDDFAHGDPGDQ
uniref:Uncharacterized protein n=1 Tax=Avena sativa TaxID=4498 RepID=A0ACD5WGD2_AVESA